MGGLDPAKLLMILLVAVIVVGPERLPRAARQLGAMWRELTKMRERLEEEVRSALPDLELPSIPMLPKRGITGYLTSMMTSAAPGAEAGGMLPGDVLDGAGSTDEEALGTAMLGWVSSPSEGQVREALPAGWNVVGAPAPGYASGSLLPPVPSVVAAAPLSAEGELSFDEPGWN
ncbi:MAG: twin-arginine translocase TatA/TatE family subunit [Actinomycetota bacterium]|nr:twin-arginine translocase TatA/TatE family subunit [Actinomycetota bacterium]